MLKSIIRTLLQKFIDDIDADNCNITMEQQSKIISVLSNIANPDQRMSKIQACDYIGVSRATFDNYVKDGFIPKGIKQEGFKELSWQKSDLDMYDDMPKYMRKYLQNYGWHFNKALCSYAISFMKKGGKSLEPVSKEYIDKVLTQNNIKLENNVGYDYVFVGNMCKADYYGSSITDERHFALYIKDTIDDEDAGDGTTMRRWYATMVANGTMVDWEDVI